ncbi:MAG: isopentenyl phosphate kinase [Chloroflexota bacterium]
MKDELNQNLVFLKLGGSLITDKLRPRTERRPVIRRLAQEIQSALQACPDMKLLIGHGSGSFGHVEAQRYQTRQGVRTEDDWLGFSHVVHSAATLHRTIIGAFLLENLPVVGIQPFSTARCSNGQIVDMDWEFVSNVFDNGLIPVVYGDASFDEEIGGTIISTEEIFSFLAQKLLPRSILIAGISDGVIGVDDQPLERITPKDLSHLREIVKGSSAVDVTGGMASKVDLMLKLTGSHPKMTVRIFSGERIGNVKRILSEPEFVSGTLLSS